MKATWYMVGPDMYMFRFFRKDGSFGSCFLCHGDTFRAEVDALEKMGWNITKEF